MDSLKPLAFFNLGENLKESDQKNQIDQSAQAERVRRMLASYKKHRETNTPTVQPVK